MLFALQEQLKVIERLHPTLVFAPPLDLIHVHYVQSSNLGGLPSRVWIVKVDRVGEPILYAVGVETS